MLSINVYPDFASLTRAAAEQAIILVGNAVSARGRCTVALAGGATPRALYALLARNDFAARVDWSHIHVFWGDERCVSPDHPDSNYRTAHETLLRHVPVPAGNVHRIRGEWEPPEAVAGYERTLRAFFSVRGEEGVTVSEEPVARFDLVILGMGDDGHTASLFSGTAVLHERRRWVVAHYVEKLRAWRITLTPVALNAAAKIIFFVAGAGKAERVREVLAGPYQPDVLSAQVISPVDGQLLWLVDAAAASRLESAK